MIVLIDHEGCHQVVYVNQVAMCYSPTDKPGPSKYLSFLCKEDLLAYVLKNEYPLDTKSHSCHHLVRNRAGRIQSIIPALIEAINEYDHFAQRARRK